MYSDVPSSSPISHFRLRFGLQRQRVTYFTSNMCGFDVTPFFPYRLHQSPPSHDVYKTINSSSICRFGEICKIQYNIIIIIFVFSFERFCSPSLIYNIYVIGTTIFDIWQRLTYFYTTLYNIFFLLQYFSGNTKIFSNILSVRTKHLVFY